MDINKGLDHLVSTVNGHKPGLEIHCECTQWSQSVKD